MCIKKKKKNTASEICSLQVSSWAAMLNSAQIKELDISEEVEFSTRESFISSKQSGDL